LAVDLPPPPLFQDAIEKNIIPQASIHSILAKYDGKTTQVIDIGSCLLSRSHSDIYYRNRLANYGASNARGYLNIFSYTLSGLQRMPS